MKKSRLRIMLIIIGIVLFISAISIKRLLESKTTLFNNQIYILVAGEGFEHVCDPNIIVNFDDNGNININFESERTNEIIWVKIFDLFPYEWEINGNIEIFDSEGNTAKKNHGTSETYNLFKVVIKSEENIKLKSTHPIDESFFKVSIHSPVVCAVTTDTNNLNNGIEELNEYLNKENYSEAEEEKVKNLLQNMFSIGTVNEHILSPAYPNISIRYNDTSYYKQKYSLRVKPKEYQEIYFGVSWEGFQQLYTIVEYQKDAHILLLKRTVDLLYLISSFLITTVIVEMIIGIKKKKKV